jgi:hypothetical protein
MKRLWICGFCLLIAALTSPRASAQQDTPCTDTAPAPPTAFVYSGSACANLGSGTFSATPLPDAVCTSNPIVCPSYGDNDHNIVSLYGALGNSENSHSTGPLLAHYNAGLAAANNIKLLCNDGTMPPCQAGSPAVVFLFIGFSNLDIEIGGGSYDA